MSKFEDEDGKPSTIVWWRPMKPTREEASLAETLVFWDISKFPVPSTFDAGRVGPTIKRFLELDGYCGNLTINAVGILTDVPPCILQALSSTGINLYHSPHGTSDIRLLISQWISKNLPPANILGICDPRGFPPPLTGFNLFRPFSYFSPEEDALLWGSSLRTVSMTTGEDMFSETNDSASWFCLTCKQLGGQGHESFSKHLSGRKHSQVINNLSQTGQTCCVNTFCHCLSRATSYHNMQFPFLTSSFVLPKSDPCYFLPLDVHLIFKQMPS